MSQTRESGMPPSDIDIHTSTSIERLIIKATGQRIYTGLPWFKMGSNKLWVFVNGKKEYCGLELDYIELTGTSIEFNKTVRSGSIIEILVFR